MRYRKSPRLTSFSYVGSYAYSLTLVTSLRRRHFADREVVASYLDALWASVNKHGCTLYAYCFMPDHVHLLLQGDDESDVREAVRLFKQRTGYEFRKKRGDRLWQTSYWDHVLRRDEDLRQVATYIWWNPVRAGLCERWDEYPFSGPLPLPAAGQV